MFFYFSAILKFFYFIQKNQHFFAKKDIIFLKLPKNRLTNNWIICTMKDSYQEPITVTSYFKIS